MFLGQIDVTSQQAAKWVDQYQEPLPPDAGLEARVFAYKNAMAKGKSIYLRHRISEMEARRAYAQNEYDNMVPHGPGGVRDMLDKQNMIDFYTTERDYAQAQLNEIQTAQRDGTTPSLDVTFKLPDTVHRQVVASAQDVWSGYRGQFNQVNAMTGRIGAMGGSLFLPGVPGSISSKAGNIALNVFTLGLPTIAGKLFGGGGKASGDPVYQDYVVPGEQIPMPKGLPTNQQVLWVPSLLGNQPIITKRVAGEGQRGLKGLEDMPMSTLTQWLVIGALAVGAWALTHTKGI